MSPSAAPTIPPAIARISVQVANTAIPEIEMRSLGRPGSEGHA